MAASPSLGSRRALLLYLAAVVGPTLVVLTAGLLAVRRQADALATSRTTTRALLELRVADDFERRVLGAVTVAGTDAAVIAAAALPLTATPAEHDIVRAHLRTLRQRHPLVEAVLVADDRELVYPRVHPAAPEPLEDWLGAPTIATPGGARLSAASTDTTSARRRAWALAADARAYATRDDPRAVAAYRRLLVDHAHLYSPAGWPYALIAATALRRLGALTPAERLHLIDLLAGQRWTLTPAQLTHHLETLGLTTESRLAPVARHAELTGQIASVLTSPAADARAPGIRAVRVAGEEHVLAVVHPPAGSPRVAGLLLSRAVLDEQLQQVVDREVGAGRRAYLGPDVPEQHAPFRSILRGWRVAIAAPPAHDARWSGLLPFGGSVLAVLLVLVMGVVLLRRDVARESELNRLRADLVSGVSHELKAPASVIRLYAETLEAHEDLSAESRHQFTQAIMEETDRLQRLLADVVDFSRIQQGQRTYALAPAPLAPVVEAVAERFRRYADLHGFRFACRIVAPASDIVMDVRAVEQAILNLLDNAVKYSGDDKSIDLELHQAADAAVVTVRDHGPGVPAAEQQRIFERFHRGSHPDRGGYGLGLYLVRHIMDAHGGGVDLESAAGMGSAFRLRFPLMKG